jgi:assimilatory nitrate reductase catalytic subunit
MHWGEEYLSGCSSTGTRLAGINALTTSAYCPTSKQPELKHTPVKILKAELPWSLLAHGLAARRGAAPRERALVADGDVPVRHLRAVRPRAQRHAVPRRRARGAAARCAGADRGALGSRGRTLRYNDPSPRPAPQWRRLVRRGDGSAGSRLPAGRRHRAEAWIRTLLQDELPAQAYGRLLLSPGRRAGGGAVARPPGVHLLQRARGRRSRRSWGAAAMRGRRTLKCARTGSCIPELQTPAEAQCGTNAAPACPS